ncbi:MAG: quinol monooxygenase YgiN [Cellvibrionaceae bacterium]|jgi:quinol monooxygenase YgiN
MIVISGTIYIKKDKVSEAIELAKVMMEKTGEEVGCISYRFYSDIESPDIFRVFEEWESEEDLQAHFVSEHMADFRPKIGKITAAPANIRKYIVTEFGPL